MMKISDIVNKEFSRSFMGYDMREVDYFLDEIIEQLETYERERQEMLTAMEYLLRELEQFDDIADDAEKQLRHSEAPQAADVPPENRTRHTVCVHPAAAPVNPDGESAPADDAETEPDDVLEELEIDGESARAVESDDAATQAPQTAAVPPEYGTERSVRVHPAAAPINPDGEPAPAADAETVPETRTQEPPPEQAPAVPDGEESADEAPAATEQPQAADDPTGKELH